MKKRIRMFRYFIYQQEEAAARAKKSLGDTVLDTSKTTDNYKAALESIEKYAKKENFVILFRHFYDELERQRFNLVIKEL